MPGRWRTNHRAGDADLLAVGAAVELGRGQDAALAERFPQVGHGVRTEGELHSSVVRQGLLDRGHFGQRRGLGVGEPVEQGTRGPAEAGHLPEGRAAGQVEGGKRSHARQDLELVPAQPAAPHQILDSGEGAFLPFLLDLLAGVRP